MWYFYSLFIIISLLIPPLVGTVYKIICKLYIYNPSLRDKGLLLIIYKYFICNRALRAQESFTSYL